MTDQKKLRLGVLDQSPIRAGGTPADALSESIRLAQAVERLGYGRYWCAEHHASLGLAGPSPEIMITRIAAETARIRVGSGGIMLPHYSPYKVAENFRLLETLYPGRIDLGIGRAPGSDYVTSRALAYGSQIGADYFPNMVQDLDGFLHDSLPADHPLGRVRALPETKSAVVVGAGMAGAAVSERLAANGWEVTLVERASEPALGASGNHAGAFHPVLTADDSHMARLTRAAFTFLLEHWRQFDAIGAAPEWQRCGVLQLARDAREAAAQHAALAALAPPLDYARGVDTREASALAGVTLAGGGLWYQEAGWIRPRSFARALIARSGARTLYGREAAALERASGDWRVLDREGAEIARAGAVVLANAEDALRLAPLAEVRLRRVRGQLTHVPALPNLKAAVLRGGMVLPEIDGVSVTGASFDLDDDDPAVRTDSHEGNLERLERMVPGAARGLDASMLAGRTAFRTVAPDRLPLIGALGAPGLYGAFAYGSRGLLWAGLGGELLASLMDGEPLPLEAALVEALAPQRFAKRAARRRAG